MHERPSLIDTPVLLDERVTVLVNSSDGFSDCWPLFFDFYERYWPGARFPILLNTETRDWSHPRLPVRCSRVALGEARRLTWSECLIRALDQVTTPLVLYFQEDYFIDRPVRDRVVEDAVALMMADPSIGHVALTKQGSQPPHRDSNFPGYRTISPRARYRISTQAGLWRPGTLRSYLHPAENGWMFEILGTWRAHRRDDLFLVADYAPEQGGPAIDYIHTGIIKGRWHPAMPGLFAQHGLDVDTERRGLYVEPDPVRRKLEVVRKLAQEPRHLVRQFFGLAERG